MLNRINAVKCIMIEAICYSSKGNCNLNLKISKYLTFTNFVVFCQMIAFRTATVISKASGNAVMRAASLVVLTTAISGGICYHETEVLSGEVNTTMQNMH